MENLQYKADFLRNQYTRELEKLQVDTPARWGKMNAWQMIEHMADYVRIANGKTPMEIITAEERLPRMRGFLESEKPMMENTPNPLLPDIPPPVKHATMHDAITELQQELDHLFEVHEKDPSRSTPNPFFGNLSFDQQVQLLYKHGTHHLKQFGIEV